MPGPARYWDYEADNLIAAWPGPWGWEALNKKLQAGDGREKAQAWYWENNQQWEQISLHSKAEVSIENCLQWKKKKNLSMNNDVKVQVC